MGHFRPTNDREVWLAILEAASEKPGDKINDEWRWLLLQLRMSADDYLALREALRQGRWRNAKNPKAYIKTALGERLFMRKPQLWQTIRWCSCLLRRRGTDSRLKVHLITYRMFGILPMPSKDLMEFGGAVAALNSIVMSTTMRMKMLIPYPCVAVCWPKFQRASKHWLTLPLECVSLSRRGFED